MDASDFNFNKATQQAIDEFLIEAAPILLEIAKKNAPHVTGHFKESLKVVKVGNEVQVVSTSEEPRLEWIRDGTRPHTIAAVNAKALAFQSSAGGEVIFARMVHHPGTEPNNFLDKTEAEAATVLTQLLEAKIDKKL